jgi:phage terminase large subunit GpA-like protein
MQSIAIKNIWPDLTAAWLPPPKLTLNDWAEQYAYLSPESAAEPGKWHAFPYQRGIMDAYSNSNTWMITIKKSARVGYTKILNHIVGYHISQDPANILIVQPTIEDAQGHSKDELAPMIRDTPAIKGLVAEVRTRDSDNTILKKAFPGGRLYLVGSNSPRGFRRISVRVVLFDEIDGYPLSAGTEGDQLKLGEKRTEFFWNRKIIKGSTPTEKDLSRIESSFLASDQRYYYVPCPFCGYMQPLIFSFEYGDIKKNAAVLKWPKGKPQKAAFECWKCKKLMPHSKKRWMVKHGEWRPHAKFNGHAGFFIWAAYSYSPNATWAAIASEFYEAAKSKDILKIKTVVNTTLGLSFEEQGDRPAAQTLKERCEPYDLLSVPRGGLVLTGGVDVQDNRIVVIIRAWGRGLENWLIYFGEIYGDPSLGDEIEGGVWTELDDLMSRTFRHASGAELSVLAIGVDSGFCTQEVYNYCRKRKPRFFALKGQSQAGKPILGRPTPQDVIWNGQKLADSVELWPVGSDTTKEDIYSKLQIETRGPGRYHWPVGTTADYFAQLTAEKKIKRIATKGKNRGREVVEWVKIAPRNDFLDAEIYARAALQYAGGIRINWDEIEKSVGAKSAGASQDAGPDRSANESGGSWATRGKGSWSKR